MGGYTARVPYAKKVCGVVWEILYIQCVLYSMFANRITCYITTLREINTVTVLMLCIHTTLQMHTCVTVCA